MTGVPTLWLPGTDHTEVEQEFRSILSEIEARDGIAVDGTFMYLAPPFELDQAHSLVTEFQSAYAATTGAELPLGFKPVLDDGNNIARLSDAPRIAHAGDEHLVNRGRELGQAGVRHGVAIADDQQRGAIWFPAFGQAH